MGSPGLKTIAGSCLLCWSVLYGTWLLVCDILFSTFPITAIGFCGLVIGVYRFKLPTPDSAIIREVLGIDPWDIQNQETELAPRSDEIGDNSLADCIDIVAHRGAGLDAPENSLIAFQKAKDKGCKAVEFDICLTADGVPIVFHDDTVDRMTDTTGFISEMTYIELQDLDISVKHPFRDQFTGTRIPKFSEVLEECINLDFRMFIDVKAPDVKIVPTIVDAFKKYPDLHKRAVVTTFYPQIIYQLRRQNPTIVCSMAWRPFFVSHGNYSGFRGPTLPRNDGVLGHLMARFLNALLDATLPLALWYILGLSALLVQKDNITSEMVRSWRERGIRVIAWTVNQPEEKLYFSKALRVTYMTDTLDAPK